MRPTHKTLCLCALLLTSLGASAQDRATYGSETYILEAPTIVGGGGSMSSTTYSAVAHLGGPTEPFNSISVSYDMWGGAELFGSVPTNLPEVFGVSGGKGVKDGGELATVFGRNLLTPGAGAATIDLGGLALTNVSILSDNVAQGTTVLGVNQYQNPLGAVDVNLQNQLGSSSSTAAFLYTPAIVVDSLPVVDGQYGLSIHAPPGSILSMSYGFTIPGVAIPLFNLDGAIELINQITPVIPLTVCPPTGHFQFVAAVPNLPSLAGLDLPLQALAFTDLVTLSGSFSNMVLLQIQ